MPESAARRAFLNHAAKGALVAGAVYLASRFPSAYAQEKEILVGPLQTPVTFDGILSSGEYENDCIPYPYQILSQRSPSRGEANLCVKSDETWTYFGFHSPTDTSTVVGKRQFWFIFNIGKDVEGNDIEYQLNIQGTNPENLEEETPDVVIGHQFYETFKRGQDYDWKHSFDPSRGTYFEVRIRNEILTEYSDSISFDGYFKDGFNNAFSIENLGAADPFVKFTYTSTPVPEFPTSGAVLVGTVALVAGALYHQEISNLRRDSPMLSRRAALRALAGQT